MCAHAWKSPCRCRPLSAELPETACGCDREKARRHHRSPFRRPDAAGRHCLAGDALPRRTRAARLPSWYVEDGGANPFDPRANSVVMACDYNVRFLQRAMEEHGFGERWSYWDAIHDVHYGLVARAQVRALYRQSRCSDQPVRRDTLAGGASRLPGADHDRYRPGLRANQIRDRRPRVARLSRCAYSFLHLWRESRSRGLPGAVVRRAVAPDPAPGRPRPLARTATMHRPASRRSPPGRTRARTSSSTAARYFWSKHVNFLRYLDVPKHRPDSCFRIAMLPPDEGVRAAVAAGGWGLVDPRPISADMALYRDFIARSRGEFTVAKDIYVRPNSGWFSDRSACYLAAGRPVVTMRTGFQQILPGRQRACSNIRTMRRRSPASTPLPPITPATAARRGNWPGNISPPTAFSAAWRLPGCEPDPAA